MDVTLDLITEEIISIDVIESADTEITVVTGVPGSDGVGVIPGGTTGQVLAKASNSNFDTVWEDPAAGTVASVNGATGIVSLTQDSIPDGTTAKQYTATEKTKLSGIQSGAQVNAVSSVAGKTGAVSLAKADVGLGSVDNTADSAKPVSTAQQAALDLKAPLASPAFTGTPTGITKSHVGLSNVDNTSDANKPVSTATSTALAGKANTTHTHAESDITNLTTDLAAKQPLDSDLTAIAALAPADDAVIQRKSSAWVSRTPAQLKTDLVLVKADVGLGNVDNTSDANKPISTAQQTALDARFVWADGTTSTNARPSTSSKVIWVGGTTQPVNMATGDLWIKA